MQWHDFSPIEPIGRRARRASVFFVLSCRINGALTRCRCTFNVSCLKAREQLNDLVLGLGSAQSQKFNLVYFGILWTSLDFGMFWPTWGSSIWTRLCTSGPFWCHGLQAWKVFDISGHCLGQRIHKLWLVMPALLIVGTASALWAKRIDRPWNVTAFSWKGLPAFQELCGAAVGRAAIFQGDEGHGFLVLSCLNVLSAARLCCT